MRVRTIFERLLYASPEEETFTRKVFLFPLYLASLIYYLLITLRHALYSSGILRSHCLPCQVISVGNITLGGTGKTPTVIYLAQILKARGMNPVILSRGYRGGTKEKVAVVSDGNHILLNVQDAGDEPYLLSKALPEVPIVIGKDRVDSGHYVLQQFSPEIVLLDDGFQYMKLRRNLDILLLDLGYGFGNGYLLPRGILREPLPHIGRAQLFLLTKRTEQSGTSKLVQKITSLKPDAKIFFADYQIKSIKTLHDENMVEPSELRGRKVLALSAIANPRYFSYLLRKHELEVVDEVCFPDHHYYTLDDARKLREHHPRADYIITTAKDSVKMDEKVFENLPILVLEIMLTIKNEHAFINELLACIER